MTTRPMTQSFRQERDTKEKDTYRCSVIFTWSAKDGENVFPKMFPFTVNNETVIYERKTY